MNKLSIILGAVIWCVGIGTVNAAGCGKQGMPQPQSKCTSLNCSGASKACCLKSGSYYCGSHLANPAINDVIIAPEGPEVAVPVDESKF